jgi:cytochrome c biogenesis protein
VQNQGFVEIDDPRTGMPLDFYSDLVLYDNGVEKARQRIRVNEPLSYAGIDFHQAYFGQAAVVRVVDVNGQELYNDGVPLAFKNEVRYGPRAFGFMRLLGGRLLIDIVGGVPNDPDISPGEVVALFYQSGNGEPFATRKLRLGQTESVGGLQLTFQRERMFTGIQVEKNPGVPIIMLAAVLMIGGWAAVFYFPHRRLWALVRPTARGGSRVSLITLGKRHGGQRFFDEAWERAGAGLALRAAAPPGVTSRT